MDKKSIIIILLVAIIGLLVYLAFFATEATAPGTTVEDIESDSMMDEGTKEPEGTEGTANEVMDTDADTDVIDPIEEENETAAPDVLLESSFTNTPYGYTVNFPKNWYWERVAAAYLAPHIRDWLWLDPNGGFLEGTEYGGMVSIRVDSRTIADILADADAMGKTYTTRAVTVDGRPATRVEYDITGGLWDATESIYVYLETGGYTYSFHMDPPSHDENLFRSIIQSFEIIF